MAIGDGRVISNFIVQALRGEPLTVYGDGSQTRSFCYVDDLVEGFIRLMQYEGDDAHEPVNLGNPTELTMTALVETLQDVVGSPLTTIRKPLPADDPTRRCPDITRARQRLGWAPTVDLRAGLARTVDFYRTLAAQPKDR